MNNHRTAQTVNKTIQLIQKSVEYEGEYEWILGIKHAKDILYQEARKVVENSLVTITYANRQIQQEPNPKSRNDPLWDY